MGWEEEWGLGPMQLRRELLLLRCINSCLFLWRVRRVILIKVDRRLHNMEMIGCVIFPLLAVLDDFVFFCCGMVKKVGRSGEKKDKSI